MTSILTNIAAQSALATLRTINSQMQNTQTQVSSGLRVSEAKDNAAYWSISTTMHSDNGAISAVEDALGLGAAKIDTAYSGMEAAIDVVKEIKKKLVTATEGSVDRNKIQEEISQLQEQLKSIADSASFSGENLLKATFVGSLGANGSFLTFAVKDVKTIVTGFVRDSNNNVSVKTTEAVQTSETVLFGTHTDGMEFGLLDKVLDIDGLTYQEGNGIWLLKTFQYDSSWNVSANGVYGNGTDYYTRYDGLFVKAVDAGGAIDKSSTATVLKGAMNASITTMNITKQDDYRDDMFGPDGEADMVLDVFISYADRQLAKMTDAASSFGSLSKRIELQSNFAAKLSDAIDSGVGRLVDADMNEESTRLKALQTQQQLGIQALSIANAQPDNVIQLFR